MEDLNNVLRAQEYINKMRPVFNKRALYSDETAQYRTPMEPEPGDIVTVRFRTLKNNVDAVYFISGTIRKEMKVEESREGFDYMRFRFRWEVNRSIIILRSGQEKLSVITMNLV